MANEKKELLKQFKVIIDDIMDNFEKYTDEEKAAVREIFEKVAALNTVLDKYDVESKFDWGEYMRAVGQYFDMLRY